MAAAAEICNDRGRQKAKVDEYLFGKNPLRGLIRLWLAGIAFTITGLAFASVPYTESAASLHAQYASLAERLQHNPFQRALSLDSSESSDELKGDIYARVDYPFATVSKALNDPVH